MQITAALEGGGNMQDYLLMSKDTVIARYENDTPHS